MASMYISISGVQEALGVLHQYVGPEMQKKIRSATLAGARALKGPIAAATPPHVHSGGKWPSDLRASVAVKVRKQDGQWLGYIVGPMGKQGWVRNFVIGGTRPHRIRGDVGHALGLPFGPRAVVHHPGARPNPYVRRVGDTEGDLVLNAMGRRIARMGL